MRFVVFVSLLFELFTQAGSYVDTVKTDFESDFSEFLY
jgi:hypothetical protein